MRSGVRCADTTPTSNGMSNSASACAAASITGQSLSLPMISPIRGAGTCASRKRSSSAMSVPSVGPPRMRQPVCRPRRSFTQFRHVFAHDVHVPDLAAGALALAIEVHLRIGDAAEKMVQPFVRSHLWYLFCTKHIGHHGDR